MDIRLSPVTLLDDIYRGDGVITQHQRGKGDNVGAKEQPMDKKAHQKLPMILGRLLKLLCIAL